MKLVNFSGTRCCCLGVACELAGVTFERDSPNALEGNSNTYGVRQFDDVPDHQHQNLPEWLSKMMDLDSTDMVDLVNCNDMWGLSFEGIAKVVEYAKRNNRTISCSVNLA